SVASTVTTDPVSSPAQMPVKESRPMTRTNPATLVATLCAAALLITGCSTGQPSPTDPDADPSASASAAPAEPEIITPAQCVIGTWQVDNAAFEAYMNS